MEDTRTARAAKAQPAKPAVPPRRVTRRQAAQFRRTHNVLLAGLLILILLVFTLINLIVRDRTFSDTENRNLAQKPSFSASALADGSWSSGVTSWYNDQFFGRDGWTAMNSRLHRALGWKESGGVFLGAEDRLLGAPETPDAKAVMASVDAINTFAGSHSDLAIRMMLVPDAAAILPEALPENAPVRDQLQDIADIRQQLTGSIQFLDAAAALQSHKEEPIYYKTDHHWTSLGAYYAFQASTGALGIANAATDYDVYTVATDFEGTLASKAGIHTVTDTIEVYAPQGVNVDYYVTFGDDSTEKYPSIYKSSALEVKDKYTVFFGGNYSLVDIHTTANNSRALLVFKDSYANCFMQFLVPYYERIIMVDPRYYYGSLESVLNYGITDVLFLYSADTFLKDTSLKDVLEAAPKTEAMPASTPDSGAAPAPETESALEDSALESSALEDSEASALEESAAEDGAQTP